jgi:hypothetical protein
MSEEWEHTDNICLLGSKHGHGYQEHFMHDLSFFSSTSTCAETYSHLTERHNNMRGAQGHYGNTST